MTFRVLPFSPLLALLIALTSACARQAESCWVCKREIHSQVRAVLTLADGRRVPACCPRCALHYQEEPGHSTRTITVTDYTSGKTLPFDRAFFVQGSDETPCVHHPNVMDDTHVPMQACYDRCMPSLIAFAKKPDAESFMVNHGGLLIPPGAYPQSSLK